MNIFSITPEFEKFLITLIQTSVQNAVASATSHLQTKETIEFLTRKQTAIILGISLVTLSEWTKQGKVKGYRIGSRVRYKRDELNQSLQSIKTR